MRRVVPAEQPATWKERALDRGIDWLKKNPNQERPTDYWSDFNSDIRTSFSHLCGYCALFLPNGTIDHFIAWKTLRGTKDEWKAYDWLNLRYAAGWLNSARKSTPVPDPFEVEDDWFELLLPSLELERTDRVPPEYAERVDNILRWLRNDPRVVDQRSEWFRMYRDKELTLEGLRKKAPLIAAALLRQPNFLHPIDQNQKVNV